MSERSILGVELDRLDELRRNLLDNVEIKPLDNLPQKLIALGLALLLWAWVEAQTVPRFVPNVPVLVENIPPDLALVEEYADTIDVTVRGSPTRTQGLAPGQLSPTIDAFGLSPGENSLPLGDEIPIPFGVEIVRIDPPELVLVLEERQRAKVPVTAVVEGEPAEGWEVIERTVDPAEVTVSGPISRVRGLDRVATEPVNVMGRRDPITRPVALRVGDPFIEIVGDTTARVSIEIREASVTRQIDGIGVEIVNADRRVAVNPQEIGVVVSAPSSLAARLERSNFRAVIDVAGLSPHPDDYRLEPTIRVQPEELVGQVEVIAKTPQRLIDVHIFDAPPER